MDWILVQLNSLGQIGLSKSIGVNLTNWGLLRVDTCTRIYFELIDGDGLINLKWIKIWLNFELLVGLDELVSSIGVQFSVYIIAIVD